MEATPRGLDMQISMFDPALDVNRTAFTSFVASALLALESADPPTRRCTFAARLQLCLLRLQSLYKLCGERAHRITLEQLYNTVNYFLGSQFHYARPIIANQAAAPISPNRPT